MPHSGCRAHPPWPPLNTSQAGAPEQARVRWNVGRQNFISNGLGTLTLDGVALNKHNRTIVHSLFLGSLILQAHNQPVHIKSPYLLIVIFVKPAPTCTPCALSPHHSIFERDVHQFCPFFVISQVHIFKMHDCDFSIAKV